MQRFLLVCVGGAIGSGARYLVSLGALAAFGPSFPYGTLAVNAVGSFFICAVMHLGAGAQVIRPPVALFLTTGVMGGFTTYSAFDYEAFRYAQTGAGGLATVYVAATLVLCFLSGMAGDAVAKLVAPA
ncbi:MAG TPA: CrcB family protein [Myxococcales bacterium]|nr:CrcB family protein [Myxococcales bacterium]